MWHQAILWGTQIVEQNARMVDEDGCVLIGGVDQCIANAAVGANSLG